MGINQFLALWVKGMTGDAVNARTLRLNDRGTPGEMTVTDFELATATTGVTLDT